jgi:hypothetical protein
MGYSHRWYLFKLPIKQQMKQINEDFLRVYNEFLKPRGIELAGPTGIGNPIFSDTKVEFNGPRNSPQGDLSYETFQFPLSPLHSKISLYVPKIPERQLIYIVTMSPNTYEANYEIFKKYFVKRDVYFDFVKTGMGANLFESVGRFLLPKEAILSALPNPYDAAVMVYLLIARHYLGTNIVVTTDGNDTLWGIAYNATQEVLGYGGDYTVECEKIVESQFPEFAEFIETLDKFGTEFLLPGITGLNPRSDCYLRP